MYVWYLLILFLVIIKVYMGPLDTPKKRKTYLVIVGTVTVFLLALRGENYGNVYDVRAYKDFYLRIRLSSWERVLANEEFEIGFVILNKLLSYILPFDQGIIVFHAVFCIFCVCRFIYRNTDEVFWAFLFFVTLGTMGFMLTGIRQAIAISICLLSVEFIKEKKFIKYLIMVLLAYNIHQSALIFALAYFLCNMEILKKKPWLYGVIVVGISLLAPQIITVGENIIDDFAASKTAVFSFNGIVPILIYAAAVVLNLLYKSNNKNNLNNLALSSMGLGFYLFRFYNMILERISFYYTPASTTLLADYMGTLKRDRNGMMIKILVIFLCVVLFARRLESSSWGDYIFIWETMI